MSTRIQIEARKVVREGKPPFWVAHPPKFSCAINLNEVKLLIFPSRNNEEDFTVFLDDPKEYRPPTSQRPTQDDGDSDDGE